MGAIKELMASYKDAHGVEPRNIAALFAWSNPQPAFVASACESMKGGERPTTALVVVAAPVVALALAAIALI